MPQIYLVNLNVNSDRRVDDPTSVLFPAFSDLSFQARFNLNASLLDSLSENNQTIFALEEANDVARDLLADYFQKKGFEVLSTKYANDPGAFNFVFAYNSKLYDLISTSQLYYTESGLSTTPEERKTLSKDEKIKRHLGTEFEKSVQFVRLMHKESGKEMLIANTHPGLEMKHRLAAMHKLCDALEHEKGMLIALGDFNQFDASNPKPMVYQEQVRVLQDRGFNWASEGLSQVGMKTTFLGSPFDILRFFNDADHTEYKELTKDAATQPQLRRFFIQKIKEKNLSLYGGCLDAVFTRGLPEQAKVSVSAFTMFKHRLVETTKIANPQELQEEFVQHFIDHSVEERAEPVTNSDHFAITTKISF